MKILAIRGRNLASLGGHFELDLEAPPFDRAGLFAITGPVGAGKSTLLDAVCLALYDRTPRLTGRGGAPVGSRHDEEPLRIPSNDVRTVLRRGAVEGFAEVVFRGRDGRCYRARWSVRRARRKITGRLQKQQVSLWEVSSGKLLNADRKQDVLDAIQEKLGLSFDQFRRSVLLAQGDFAAFLKSDAKDRAELLERMTGTEIYRRISQRAYERQQEEGRRLLLLQEASKLQEPLEDAGRRALERDLEQATRESERLSLEEASAVQACEWYATEHRLRELSDEAKASCSKIKAAWAASAGLREQLGRAQAAQPLRPILENLDRARRELGKAAESHTACAVELGEVNKEELLLAEASAKADAALLETEGRQRELLPDLKAANELDILLAETAKGVQDRQRRDSEARSALTEVERRVKELHRELEASRETEAGIRSWLTEHGQLQRLDATGDSWRRDLDRYRKTFAELRRLEEQRAASSKELAQIQGVLRQAENEMSRCRAELLRARSEMERARAGAQGVSIADLRRRQRDLARQRETLEGCRRLVAESCELRRSQEELREKIEAARSRSKTAAAEASEHGRAREAVAAALSEARRALSAAETARSLKAHRRALREGEPCPLCGSTHHPLAHEPFEDLLVEQRRRVNALAEEHERQAGAEAGGRAALASWEERTSALREDEVGLAARLRDLLAGWNGPGDPWASGVRESIEERITDLEGSSAGLEVELGQAEASLRACEQAAAGLQRVQDSWQAAVEAVESAKQSERIASNDRREIERELHGRRSGQEEILSRLAPAMGDRAGWQEELQRDPERFVESWAERASLFSSKSEELAALTRRSEELKRQIAEHEVLRRERERSREKLALELGRQDRELEAVKGRRSALLGGRPTAEVENELAESLRQRRKLREEAATRWKRAQVRHAEAMVRFQHMTRSREARRRAVEEAEGRLTCAAESAEIPLGEVALRLQHDAAWIRAREREVTARKRDLERAETIAAERESRRLQHVSNGRPELPAEQARETLARIRVQAKKAGAELARIRVELGRDDDARQRLSELGPKVEAQTEVVETWRALNDLIGSARGDRFQVFAQSLTLDALLCRANHHLHELARRYRLVRVPGTDLDLQVVDQEMGEATRSIHSLSGGESFLVSLALALGLSSLSARRTPIETLFIDEGFGSLDPISLETALAALDALQATGRQVGIVSHVEGLAERIGISVEVLPEGGGRSRLIAPLGRSAAATRSSR